MRSEAGGLHFCGDRLAAPMNEDRIDADRLEKHDIAQEFVHHLLVLHRGAAVFDDKSMAAVLLDVGKRLDQRLATGFGSHFCHYSPRFRRTYSSVRSVVQT